MLWLAYKIDIKIDTKIYTKIDIKIDVPYTKHKSKKWNELVFNTS